jgi:hypothetical protein
MAAAITPGWSQDLEYVGSALWTGLQDIQVEGTYAYVVFKNGLTIFDISDSTAPAMLGRAFCYGEGRRCAVTGDYTLLAGGLGGLYVIDMTDRANPVIAARVATDQTVSDVVVIGNYAFAASELTGLLIIDIALPTNPQVVGAVGMPNGLGANVVCVAGQYAYLGGTDRSFLGIVNVADPLLPVYVGGIEASYHGWSTCISVVGNFAYMGIQYEGFPYNEGNLYTFDVSNPVNPVITGSLSIVPVDMRVVGQYILMAVSYGIELYSLADPSNPTIVDSYYIPSSEITGIEVAGNLAFTAELSGFRALDMSDLFNPVEVSYYESSIAPCDIAIAGDYAYVTRETGALLVVDIADLSLPILLGNCPLSSMAYGVVVRGQYAYVANYGSGMAVVNIGDPWNPAVVTVVPPHGPYGRVFSVFNDGQYIYVADFDNGLSILNVDDPTLPTLAGFYPVENNSLLDVFVQGIYAYLGCSLGAGLRIVNVENPASPTLVGSCETQNGNSVYVVGDYAYMGTPGGFQVLDIIDKTNPVIIGQLANSGLCVSVEGDRAYLGSYETGLLIADISDPANPSVSSRYFVPGQSHNLMTTIDHCFVASEYSLLIFNRTPYAGCAYRPGDINNVPPANGIDITYGVSYLKGGNPPPVNCSPPCPQPAPFYAAMDVNGSCTTNGIDITYFVGFLKGGPSLLYCENCPPME